MPETNREKLLYGFSTRACAEPYLKLLYPGELYWLPPDNFLRPCPTTKVHRTQVGGGWLQYAIRMG